MGQELRMEIVDDFRSNGHVCGPHRDEKGAKRKGYIRLQNTSIIKKCCNVTTFNDDVQVHFVAGRTIVMTGLALIVTAVRGLYLCNDDTGS